jgi:uncharacterized membrane protein
VSLAPILAAPPVVQAHLALTLLALASGTSVLFAAKGTPFHRRAGTIFAVAMMLAAATSFAIREIWAGSLSPIHVLSLVTLATIPIAIWRRRVGDIRGHAIGMALNYAGLVVAGLFALMAPRVLHTALFAS